MPNYSNGKIYSIRFYDNDKLIYIGSTIQPLAVRFGGHKRSIKSSVFKYIQDNFNGDFKSCYIELLEPYECNNKNELNKKEGEIIRQYRADENYKVLNKVIAGRSYKEYYNEEQNKLKQYRQDNIDRKKEYDKKYREENITIIKEKKREYNKKNADKIKEYNKQYKQKKTEKGATEI